MNFKDDLAISRVGRCIPDPVLPVQSNREKDTAELYDIDQKKVPEMGLIQCHHGCDLALLGQELRCL
jgi:hypothetical protein